MIGHRLVALDPSINSCGLTLVEGGAIVHAARITADTGEFEMGARCVWMANLVATHLEHRPDPRWRSPNALVFEWPQILTHVKSKGDPNDLPPMAGVGSALAALLGVSLQGIYSPQPNEWIGGCPKVCPKCKGVRKAACKVCRGSAWRTPRGYRIAEALTPHERALIPDQHDVIDSAGLALWKSGRLVLARNFPGAV